MLLTVPAWAAPKRTAATAEPFPNAERLMEWVRGYRANPEPKKLPAAVRAMRDLGLVKDIEASGVFIGFIAGVLGTNGDKAAALVADMYPMPPEDQPLIIKAIAYSDLPDWRELLSSVVERMPARRVMIEHYLYGQGKTLYELPLEEGMAPLDTLWGYYFATGSAEPVQRIITALDWAKEPEDLDKLTSAGMSKWTLASNALRDSDLVRIYQDELSYRPSPIATELREVISAAELFETQKLRKSALSAIEDLRRKGPIRKSTWWSWAAGAAPTAVGLACVVASAAGQVEFGVPCIIGGALSTVGAKYFGTP